MKTNTIQHPKERPIFRWRPDLVSGIPICRESFPLAAEIPNALFNENDTPGMPRFLRAIFVTSRLSKKFALCLATA